MRLGLGGGGFSAAKGAVLTASKFLDALEPGSIIRNGCDSNDPDGHGVHLVKVRCTAARHDTTPSHPDFEWAWYNPTLHKWAVPNDIPFTSADVFLPVQVIGHLDDQL